MYKGLLATKKLCFLKRRKERLLYEVFFEKNDNFILYDGIFFISYVENTHIIALLLYFSHSKIMRQNHIFLL